MSRCKEIEELLDAYMVGLKRLDALDRRHIEECADCAAALLEAETLHQALMTYAQEMDRVAEEVIDSEIPLEPVAGAGNWASIRFAPRVLFPLLGVAVVLAMVATVLVFINRSRPDPERQLAYLRAIDRQSAETEIRDYLDRSKSLLLILIDEASNCRDGKVKIESEKKLAQSLIYQKKLLDARLAQPAHQDVKDLCDELELLFLDVAASESCVGRETLRLWQRVLETRATLMKLNLVRTEGRT